LRGREEKSVKGFELSGCYEDGFLSLRRRQPGYIFRFERLES
jgi:hypothetical protein